jgi:hypothetical protein
VLRKDYLRHRLSKLLSSQLSHSQSGLGFPCPAAVAVAAEVVLTRTQLDERRVVVKAVVDEVVVEDVEEAEVDSTLALMISSPETSDQEVIQRLEEEPSELAGRIEDGTSNGSWHVQQRKYASMYCDLTLNAGRRFGTRHGLQRMLQKHCIFLPLGLLYGQQKENFLIFY